MTLISGLNWNLECWFLWRKEDRRTQRETLRAGVRTNTELNPHVTPGLGIGPGPQRWQESALTTPPSLHSPLHQGERTTRPTCSKDALNNTINWINHYPVDSLVCFAQVTTLNHWIVVYLVDSVIHSFSNWSQGFTWC